MPTIRVFFFALGLALVGVSTTGFSQVRSPAPAFGFKKSTRILLDVGPKGSFDSCRAKYPSIMKVGDRWRMWYNGRTDDCFTGSIGLVKSPDGLTWTKANDGKPVFRHGAKGTFDSTKVDHPAVLRFDDRFHIRYSAVAGDRGSIRQLNCVAELAAAGSVMSVTNHEMNQRRKTHECKSIFAT